MPARSASRAVACPCAEAFCATQVSSSSAYAPLPPSSYPAPVAAAGLGGALSRLALHDDAAAAASYGGGLTAPLSPMRRGVLPPPPPLLKGPSGPRRAGEGVEEEEQAVVAVEKLANGGLQARTKPSCFISF